MSNMFQVVFAANSLIGNQDFSSFIQMEPIMESAHESTRNSNQDIFASLEGLKAFEAGERRAAHHLAGELTPSDMQALKDLEFQVGHKRTLAKKIIATPTNKYTAAHVKHSLPAGTPMSVNKMTYDQISQMNQIVQTDTKSRRGLLFGQAEKIKQAKAERAQRKAQAEAQAQAVAQAQADAQAQAQMNLAGSDHRAANRKKVDFSGIDMRAIFTQPQAQAQAQPQVQAQAQPKPAANNRMSRAIF